MSEVAISAATALDRGRVIGLWQAAGLTRPWNDPVADFDRAFGAAHATVLIATRNDELVGTVMVGEDGHRGWVYYLASDPAARRSGIGRALMDAAEDWLKTRKCPKIQFMVREDNDDALGFYRALGYERQAVTTLGRFLDED